MTIQEMFDKAYIGLASQGFEKCKLEKIKDNFSPCAYSDGKGNHCAWGWIDLSLGPEAFGVINLWRHNIGVAGTLDQKQLGFAVDLQGAHDTAADSKDMKKLLNDVAKRYNLSIPNVVL